jgi:putative phosphoribosyl transferase
VIRNRETSGLPIAFAGSSGAAAGAIVAAAQRPDLVSAVVSIDGRTNLAVDHLSMVRSPVLLVVKDMPVLRMNREALARIRAERRIEIVHGEECEAVDCVVQKSVYWLEDKLGVLAREVVPA